MAAEPFHVWVIQGPKAIAAELPLAEAGLDVIWTDDLKPYPHPQAAHSERRPSTVGDLAAKVETAIAAIEDAGVRGALARLGLAGPERSVSPEAAE